MDRYEQQEQAQQDEGAMDQVVSYEAIERLKDQKAIKVVMDRQQATDQGISKSRCDGSGSNDWSDGWMD